MDLEERWRRKSDQELEAAGKELAGYTEEAEQAIRAEMKRRGLPEPPTFIRTAHQQAVESQGAEDYIREQVRIIHQGKCPRCNGHGPVDVHKSYWVWSALLFTRWGSNTNICCRTCGKNEQLKASLTSLVVGWWGFPWGFIMTPTQIIQNLIGLFGGPSDAYPSENLHIAVYQHLEQNSTAR